VVLLHGDPEGRPSQAPSGSPPSPSLASTSDPEHTQAFRTQVLASSRPRGAVVGAKGGRRRPPEAAPEAVPDHLRRRLIRADTDDA
jgi:hypothetical protein